MALYEHKDESILDPRDTDLAKLKYDYLCAKIDEATELVEKQLELLRANDRMMAEIDEALKIVKAKGEGVKDESGSDG